ncbi:Cap15 family cyclic dinucleotide receptor domain-containing protein [Blastococcus sp. SYSU D00813]
MTAPQKAVRFAAIGVSVAYAITLYLVGVELDGSVKSALSYLPTLAVLGVVAFDKWVWRWPGIIRLHTRPRLDGLWSVALKPDKRSHIPKDGNWGPIQAYVVVEQTFWTISIAQFTKESVSHSRAAVFIPRQESRRSILSFTYDNVPSREHIGRSPRHVGACELETAGDAPKQLRGVYFTDRFTAGDMLLELVDRSADYGSFAQCHEHTSHRATGDI